jgi:hypothetical protein
VQFDRYFRLADGAGRGISCDKRGLFVGDTPLLEQVADRAGRAEWRPRRLSDLNRELAKAYSLPVEFGSKIGGLATVARALNRADLVRAQIATLLMQIPDPPALTKSNRTKEDVLDLVRALQAGDLLNRDWDASKHPRWPAHAPGGVGGQFAPRDGVASDMEPAASIVPAQATVTVPWDIPALRPLPLPSEVVPPIVVPDTLPRRMPRNPYPSRPECVKEWEEADEYCKDLRSRGLLGKGDYRGMGKTLSQCIMGRVSEACGGNSTSA